MNKTISTKAVMVLTVLVFSLLTCYGQDEQSDQVAGKWVKKFNERTVTLSILSDHTYQVEFAGDEGIDVWGRYEISGNQITFNDEGGDYSADVAGVYEITAEGDSLVFKEVNDPVNGRKILMVGSWSNLLPE